MRNKYGLGFLALCVVLGFSIAVQFRSVDRQDELRSTEMLRADELQQRLIEEQEKTDELYEQVLKLQAELTDIEQQAAEQGGYVAVLAGRLEQAQTLAGLSTLEGPGVRITMEDSQDATLNSETALIHDSDLLLVLNELWAAGAEAVSLNGERLLATSEIRCAGSTVSVNNRRYSTPFIIEAIGDGDKLHAALTMRFGAVEVLSSWGIVVQVEPLAQLSIPAYDGVLEFEYAKEPEGEGGA